MRRRGARRRRQADPAEHAPTRRWCSTPAARTTTTLLRGGVKLYERRDALLHAKTAVIDGVWATVGSTNLDWRSFLHNQELTAVILGHRIRREDARGLRARPRRVRTDHPRGLAQPRPIGDARQGNVRSTVGVLAVSTLVASSHARSRRAAWLLAWSRSLGLRRRRRWPRTPPRCARSMRRCRTSSPTTSSAGRWCSNRSQTSGDLKGDVYAVVDHPFAMVQQALQSADHWCDILILHLNVKRCRRRRRRRQDGQPAASAASSTSRSRTPTSSTSPTRVAAATPTTCRCS